MLSAVLTMLICSWYVLTITISYHLTFTMAIGRLLKQNQKISERETSDRSEIPFAVLQIVNRMIRKEKVPMRKPIRHQAKLDR